jgi:hypothetical protein
VSNGLRCVDIAIRRLSEYHRYFPHHILLSADIEPDVAFAHSIK